MRRLPRKAAFAQELEIWLEFGEQRKRPAKGGAPDALSAAILSAAGAETITAQNRPARLWFERHGVRLSALIANNIETLTVGATTTAASLL